MNRWQLFESKKGWREASGQLTEAMRKALVGRTRGSSKDAESAYEAWRQTAWELREFGAADTEPCDEAAARIVRKLRVPVPQRPWIGGS